jgi:hypothetical protein
MGCDPGNGYRVTIRNNGGRPMSFVLYILGLVLVIGGIAWALVAAHVATTYVAIVCLIVAGIGVMMAVSRTRLKDPSN